MATTSCANGGSSGWSRIVKNTADNTSH